MNHPFLRNAGRLSLYILVWTAAAIALGAAMAAALPGVTLASGVDLGQASGVAAGMGLGPGLSFAQGLGAGAILAFTFGVLALPLWDAMRYGSLTGGNPLTRLLSHVTLALITMALWLGISAGIGALTGPPSWPWTFLPVLPFLLVTGTLLYIVVTLVYAAILTASAREEADEEEADDAARAAGAENGSARVGAVVRPRLAERSPQPAEVSEAVVGGTEDAAPASAGDSVLAPPHCQSVRDEVQANPPWAFPPLENIAVKTGRKIDMIPVDDILYLKSEGDYVMIHTATGRFLKEQTMKQFEESLPPERFVRVHRSYMVNLRAISRIERYGKGEHLLILHNGATVRASEVGFRALRSRLKL